MPSGQHLTKHQREHLIRWYFYEEKDIVECYHLLFGIINPEARFSLTRLKRIVFSLVDQYSEDLDPLCIARESNLLDLYVIGNLRSGGPKRCLDKFAQDYILHMLVNQNYRRLSNLCRDFIQEFYTFPEHAPSFSTIVRFVSSENFTRKVMERRHIRQDPIRRLEFMEEMSRLSPDRIVDLDEMPASPDQFLERYGYAPIGKKSIKCQINIGNRHFSVIAAYTWRGFLPF